MIQNYRKELSSLRENFFKSENLHFNTLETIHSFTKAVDKLVCRVFEDNIGKNNSTICLVALGGYGRLELCPHSDIDILVIHEDDHKKEDIARFVRALWDTGFPLGCVVRSITECKKILGEDTATDSSLLETRYLCGNHLLHQKLIQMVVKPYFQKRSTWFLSEMQTSLKNGLFAPAQTLYMVEPDLKSGICTLRDSQRMIWSQRVVERLFTEANAHDFLPLSESQKIDFQKAYEYLLKIRSCLHMVAGRRIDILEFSFQNEVADLMGLGTFGAGVLMEQFFKAVSTIKFTLLSYLEHRSNGLTLFERIRRNISSVRVNRKIFLLDGILYGSDSDPPAGVTAYSWIMSIFEMCLSYQANLSVQLQSKIRFLLQNSEETLDATILSRFITMLSARTHLGLIIRNMHETGFLGKLIPEFELLRCKVEYDSYHEFTVDQHTIMAFSIVDTIDSGKDNGIGNITLSAADLCLLRLTVLLHDIGKSQPGNHSQNGVRIASVFLDKLTIPVKDRQRILFLIEHHLELSTLSFRRMPGDHTFTDFARIIADRKTLDMLYILTIADIKSVGLKTWTEWKGMLLFEAYKNLLSLIENSTKYPNVLSHKSDRSSFSDNQIKLLEQVSNTDDLILEMQEFAGFEQLTVCGRDRPHFFEEIVGCLSSEGYNILSATIFTTSDNKALDIFQLEPDTVVSIRPGQRIANIRKKWEQICNGSKTVQSFIDERLKKYPRKAFRSTLQGSISVTINNSISPDYTVIEVKSPDRFALLYRISHCLSNLNINIISAKLSTLISLVNDVFYVCGPDGKKLEKIALHSEIKEKLRTVLTSR